MKLRLRQLNERKPLWDLLKNEQKMVRFNLITIFFLQN